MQRPWYQSYQKGVPHTVDPSQYSSVADIMQHSFRKYADRPAFTNMGKTLTYAELEVASLKFASFLQRDLRLKKGDRVALMMPNILQYPVALFGILQGGFTAVNVNPLYTPRELEHQLKDSGAETIIILSNFAHTLQKVIDKTPVKTVIVTDLGDMLGFPKSLIINAVVKYVKKMVPAYSLPKARRFNDCVAAGDASSFEKQQLRHEDIAFLQYTGGTTGVSKGAILTHGNICANVVQAKAWIAPVLVEGAEVIVTPLPLYHIFSLTANCLVFSSVGGLNVLITNPKDIPGFVKELKKWKFTAFTGVNTLFNALNNNADFAGCDFSALKLTLGGGMAVQKAVAEKWKQTTGVPLIEAYGLTETSPAACINPMNSKEYNGYIGLPISSTDVVIKNDDGKTLEQGEVGEVCIKGPQVMKGYWNRDDETAKVMTTDGFFKTGDVGYMTPEGFIKLVDRKKDMILVSGFNVYPNEVEDIVATHPKVLECAAIGMPDEKSGEVVKIFIVRKDPTLTPEEIIEHCRKELTAYKVPREVEFRKELPKTNVGKILRRELRG
jgi:long-chain acyl-CoA synthetase